MDGLIKLWAVATGRNVATIKAHASGVRCLAFSPDRKTLVSGSTNGGIDLWDAATRKHLATLQAEGADVAWVRSLAYSPDGKTLASAGVEGVKLWDVTLREADSSA